MWQKICKLKCKVFVSTLFSFVLGQRNKKNRTMYIRQEEILKREVGLYSVYEQ